MRGRLTRHCLSFYARHGKLSAGPTIALALKEAGFFVNMLTYSFSSNSLRKIKIGKLAIVSYRKDKESICSPHLRPRKPT